MISFPVIIALFAITIGYLPMMVYCSNATIHPDLKRFTSVLERETAHQSDIVFVLDESGSIGADIYKKVKIFTELLVRYLPVSAERNWIGVISFSDAVRIKVDFFNDNNGKNMCAILLKISQLHYATGGTYTRIAMEEAGHLLKRGRPRAKKIIVLITDGESNAGYDPIPQATVLKNSGVIIFAIGVAAINDVEVYNTATDRDHVYILTKFDHIADANEYIKKETEDLHWELASDPSMCVNYCTNGPKPNCCTQHSTCHCGIMGGSYACVCDAGFEGNSGHHCTACSKGYFKEREGNVNCVKCPVHSTTQGEGATSAKDCFCEQGYEVEGDSCKPVKCAQLSAPHGGRLIPTNCSNVFGSECKLRCEEGHCPYSCSIFEETGKRKKGQAIITPWNHVLSRHCLETRQWSELEFHCEKIMCPVLDIPLNGHHNCSGSDFAFGTVCNSTCDTGYDLFGSTVRRCLSSGVWSGRATVCEKISCSPLKLNQNLKLKPEICGRNRMPYSSKCRYTCINGYDLMSEFGKYDGLNECLENKTWSGAKYKIHCADITPPVIKCPKSIESPTDPQKSTAFVKWDLPEAYDNVDLTDLKIKYPTNIRKPFYSISIGTETIKYEASDSSGLTSTCEFTITVKDTEPPQILYCPADIEVFHKTNEAIPVQWETPKFFDNSGHLNITNNRKSGDEFSWESPTLVFYNATDKAGNMVSCSFLVKVKYYPCPDLKAPVNGLLACDKWFDGRICSVQCHEEYKFPSNYNSKAKYLCMNNNDTDEKLGHWMLFSDRMRQNSKSNLMSEIKIPDCLRINKKKIIKYNVQMNYSVPQCNEQVIEEMKLKFVKESMRLDRIAKGMFCPVERGCRPENVVISCSTPRSRRSIQAPKKDITLTVKFSISIEVEEPNELSEKHPEKYENLPDDEEKSAELALPSNDIMKYIETLATENVKKVLNTTTLAAPTINYKLKRTCSTGQIKRGPICLSCPPGTFKDDFTNSCLECPSATYQDKEDQMSCVSCPVGYTTYKTNSISLSDCKAPCKPGSYSKTTFEPCELCPIGKYQNSSGKQHCMQCPFKRKTWRIGSNSSNDCRRPCEKGHYSDTGLAPCTKCEVGYYQESRARKKCKKCPEGLTTKSAGTRFHNQCLRINMCETHKPCGVGSTCIPEFNDYKCECPFGKIGKHCNITFDPCSTNPCYNGECVNKTNGYHCDCFQGFKGEFCEIDIDDCTENLCQNGGRCIDKNNSYKCACSSGFQGMNCEINIDDCENSPCLNGGVCIDKIDSYRCCCAKGYEGINCELKSDICSNVQCNNGACMSFGDFYSCNCPTGFVGKHCEYAINYCDNDDCLNGAQCINEHDGFKCNCTYMFTGELCQTALLHEYFLNFKTLSTANFVEIKNEHRLQEITVSFFMRSTYSDQSSRPTPLSYSYFDSENKKEESNGFTLFDTNNFILYLFGNELYTKFSANKDSQWHHYAVTWAKYKGRWSFIVDGNIIVQGDNIGENSFIWPGTFILGQEQDSLGGAFSSSESFVGDIQEFNVWDYVLTLNEIQSIAKKCGTKGNIISWIPIQKNVLHGNVNIIKDTDLCNNIGRCIDGDCHCVYSSDVPALENYCKHRVDDCLAPYVCANINECVNNRNSQYFCNCSNGFAGRTCKYDIDECLSNNGGCSHTCINTMGSYKCSCSNNLILSQDGLNCEDPDFCDVNGRVYLTGEKWVSECNSCECAEGHTVCKKSCEVTECRDNESLTYLPGECCPKCINYSTCKILSEDRNVTLFDGTHGSYTTQQTENLLEDCIDGSFLLQFHPNEDAHNASVLVVHYDCTQIDLDLSGKIQLNGIVVDSNLENHFLNIHLNSEIIVLTFKSGLHIQYTFVDSLIAISTPLNEKYNLCGICARNPENI